MKNIIPTTKAQKSFKSSHLPCLNVYSSINIKMLFCFFMIGSIGAFPSLSQVQNRKVDLEKLRLQLAEDIHNEFYVFQDEFDNHCCDKNNKGQLKPEILSEYNTIQNEINSCLKLKHRIFDPTTKEEKDFEMHAASINKELANRLNDPGASPGVKADAYKKLKKYIAAQNRSRQNIKNYDKNRKFCVGRDYQILKNTLKPKLSGHEGEAYRYIKRCLTPIGDLRYKCHGITEEYVKLAEESANEDTNSSHVSDKPKTTYKRPTPKKKTYYYKGKTKRNTTYKTKSRR